jgi:hypothetical protein
MLRPQREGVTRERRKLRKYWDLSFSFFHEIFLALLEQRG